MEIIDLEQQIIVKNKPDSFYAFPDNWQLRSFGEIIISSQYGISSSLGGFYSVPILKMNNLQDGHIDLRGLDYIQLSKVEMESLLLKRGDLLINRTNSPDLVGKTAVYDLDGEHVFASYLVRFRIIPSVLPVFVSYFLNSKPGQSKLKLLATKAVSQANINPSTLKKRLFVPIPPLPEQRAIATALSDVDALITSLNKLIAKKRDIKQATMQQLLMGKTRLPGFSKSLKTIYKQTEFGLIPSDWEVKKLRDVADFLDGRRKPVKESDRAKMRGEYPYYGASGVVDYVDDYIFDEELILLGEDGENILSRNCKLAFRVSGKIWVNNHAHVLKPNTNIDINFLTEYLESLDYGQFNTGTAQPKLNKRVCSEIIVFLPSFSEQTAITTVLSDMDAEIAALEHKREKTRMLKQGMMQELLTGKTRLL